MRAIVLEEPGRLAEREVADPVAAAGEVLIEVSACGVCRTDLQIVQGDLEMRRRPLIPGHQVVGPDRRHRRAGGGGLAARRRRHLRRLPPRAREPVPERRVHGLDDRRRLCRADHGPARLRVPAARGVHRPRGGAAPVRGHHRLPLAADRRRRARALGSASTASAPPPTWRSRSRCTGAARWPCSPGRSASGSWPSGSAPPGPAATTTRRRGRSTRRSRSRRSDRWWWRRCGRLRPGRRSP